METLVRDIRQTFRLMRSHRGFAVATLITIALGVGGTTAVFSVVYGVLLRPLPYAEPERLVRLWEVHPGAVAPLGGGALLSNSTYHELARSSATLSDIGAFRTGDFTVTSPGVAARRVRATGLTPSMFRLLHVSPVVGRLLRDGDVQPGAAPVVVLAYTTWRERFGGDPGVIGQVIAIDDVDHQIVGVAPPGFSFPAHEAGLPDGPREIALYKPLAVPDVAPGMRVISILDAIGRLRPGATIARAEAEGTAFARGVHRPFAELVYGNGGPVEVRVRSMAHQMTMTVRPALLVLAAGIGLVLLIACANVANLFLSRGADRARELAVRAALGADRQRLLRQLVTESLAIALTGGLLGMVIGWALTAAVPALAPSGFPRLEDIHVDPWFLLAALLAAVFVGTVSGVVPAWRSARVDLAATMHAGGARSVGSSGGAVRRVLLIVEAALAVVLLVGATLLARSFVSLVHVDAGYDPANVLTADVHLTGAATGAKRAGAQLAADVLARVRALPGVRAAGAGSMAPFGSTLDSSGFALPGVTMPDGQPVMAHALQAIVTPGYAEALGMRLKAGRFFRAEDTTSSIISMIVNETFVKTYSIYGRPIEVGRRFNGMFPRLLGRTDAVVEIVGVVADVLPDSLDARPRAQIYLPDGAAFTMRGATLVVKTDGDPLAVAPLLRGIVRQLESGAALDRVGPLADKIADSVGQPRFAVLVLAAFAVLALVLATTGLYGVLSYNIAQRRREIGVRAALGATRGDLMRMVLREGLTVTATGLAAGLLIAALATRAMASLLFGVTALDRVAFSVGPLLLLVVAGAACLIPARRAATLDPVNVLKAE